MRSKAELKARAVYLASLIRKHGGWLEDNDVIRFPSIAKREAFEAELGGDTVPFHHATLRKLCD